ERQSLEEGAGRFQPLTQLIQSPLDSFLGLGTVAYFTQVAVPLPHDIDALHTQANDRALGQLGPGPFLAFAIPESACFFRNGSRGPAEREDHLRAGLALQRAGLAVTGIDDLPTRVAGGVSLQESQLPRGVHEIHRHVLPLGHAATNLDLIPRTD